MKNQKLLLSFLVLATLSLPSFAQEKAEVVDPLKNIEVLNVASDDPILLALTEDGKPKDCEQKGTPAVLNKEANNNLLDLAKHLVKDTGGILLAPIGWKKEEWLKATAIMAGIAIVSTQDDMVKKFSQDIRSSDTEKVSWGLEKLSNGGSSLALLGGTYVTALLIKDQKLKVTALTAVEGLAVAAVLTTVGKNIFHRTRPNSTDNQYEFSGPALGGGNVSFPSGHTGSIFAVATVFAESYKDTKLVPIIAYSIATLSGLSRIHDNKHWASDVLGGAVLGYLAGKYVADRRLNKTDDENKIKITPSFNLGKGGGFNVSVVVPLNGKKKKTIN
jgi:membrane-associated phospholipid phosphatase